MRPRLDPADGHPGGCGQPGLRASRRPRRARRASCGRRQRARGIVRNAGGRCSDADAARTLSDSRRGVERPAYNRGWGPGRPRYRRSAGPRWDEGATLARAGDWLQRANYSSPIARQHWSAWRVGAEARVPLGFETVTAVLRGYWMPLVSVAVLARPNVALATDVGVDWRGRRLGIGALYSFERYDFPATNAAQRLEELSTI